ncbi:MAG: translation initiation factor IF-2 [Candidatus Eremiobacteraeota bacterium]|nr:translation initiation factor IF-2 [Candidatus Eremiobacteraeota bacterium]
MGKVRVYELARELGMEDSKPLMRILRDMGYKVKTASSGLSPDAVRKIREVVAPHIEQARRDAEQKQKAEEAAKEKGGEEAPKVKVRRAVRIVNRASEAQKQALMDRQARIAAGETPVRTAAEAMEVAEEKRRVEEAARREAEEAAALEAAEKERVEAEERAKAEAEAEPVPAEVEEQPAVRAETVSPEAEEPTVTETKEEAEARRRRELPPDQLIAAQYRDPAPAPAPARPSNGAPPARNDRGGDRPRGGGGSGPSSAPPGDRDAGRGRGGPGSGGGSGSDDDRDGAKKGGAGAKGRGGGRTREITQKSRAPRRHNTSFSRGGLSKRRKKRKKTPEERAESIKTVEVPEIISLADLADKLEVPASDVIKYLLKQGQMVTKNQGLEYDDAANIVKAYGFKVKESEDDEELDLDLLEEEEDPGDESRPPVVTVLGHVDHGKTSLLDAIRKTKVTEGEAGGITQSIGAYNVTLGKKSITFIDTPGHEAFTAMRARGAQVTDVAILVVAADDGVMPQTIEAINHVRAAEVPFIIAMNKIDKSDANPDRLMQQLAEHNIVVEDWGGEVPCVKVSALKGDGLDELMEMINLVAEMQELKADSTRQARGIIIEAGLDKGLGPVATVLVQNGTLNQGDMVVVGDAYGRVRVLLDDKRQPTKEAGPSIPVSIVGLSDVPDSGDTLEVVDDEKMARQVSEARTEKSRKERIKGSGRTTLEELFSQVKKGEQKELRILIKGDTQGSVEAISGSLLKLTTDEVKVDIVHGAVGAISESDIMLASASDAIIIGFNVRPATAVKRMADQEDVELRLYKVIYHAIEDVEKAMTGLLAPDIKEVELGKTEVREVFRISKVGQVAGCYVVEGKITRDSQIRVVRDGILVHEGKLSGLRRFKDDVKEVAEGYECGISIANFNDIQERDIIESFREESVARESL